MRYFRFFLVFCFFNLYVIAKDIIPGNMNNDNYCGPVKIIILGYMFNKKNTTDDTFYIKFGVNKLDSASSTSSTSSDYSFKTKEIPAYATNSDNKSNNRVLFFQFLLAAYALQPTIYIGNSDSIYYDCDKGKFKSGAEINYLLLYHGELK